MFKKIVASVAVAGMLMVASPAIAATGKVQTAGATCTESGAVVMTKTASQYCSLNDEGKLVWSKLAKSSKAKLSMADAWVKVAEKTGMMSMSAAFGTFVNNSSEPIRLVAAYSSITGYMQLHEVVMKDGAMKMQQKEGGFLIPAGGSYQLKPGADHAMIMTLKKSITPGQLIGITFIASDGQRFYQPFLAKVYSGGNETYDSTPAKADAGMSMGN